MIKKNYTHTAGDQIILSKQRLEWIIHGMLNKSQKNGEPGYIWLENARTRGRMKDGYRDDDLNVMGFNPCVEQQLEDASFVVWWKLILQSMIRMKIT